MNSSETIDSRALSHGDEGHKSAPCMSENKAIIRMQKKNAKINRETGKEYLGYRRCDGKVKQDVIRFARKQSMTCKSEYCSKSTIRQCNLFTENEQLKMFDRFWEMNWD